MLFVSEISLSRAYQRISSGTVPKPDQILFGFLYLEIKRLDSDFLFSFVLEDKVGGTSCRNISPGDLQDEIFIHLVVAQAIFAFYDIS